MSSQVESEKGNFGQDGNVAATAGERRRAALGEIDHSQMFQSLPEPIAEIDEAKFSWFHAKACIVAGQSTDLTRQRR